MLSSVSCEETSLTPRLLEALSVTMNQSWTSVRLWVFEVGKLGEAEAEAMPGNTGQWQVTSGSWTPKPSLELSLEDTTIALFEFDVLTWYMLMGMLS